MYHRQKPPLRTSVIVTNDAARDTLVAVISADPRLRVISSFDTLANAYASTESSPPDLVVCSRDIARQPEFAMFEALIRIIGGQIISVHNSVDTATVLHALRLPSQTPAAPDPCPALALTSLQKFVAIGASTGGIEALTQILSAFPDNCPPTMIVQHIKPNFLDNVVERLNRLCAAHVQTATDGHRLQPGQVVFAPGLATHLEVDGKSLRCRLLDAPPVFGHRPSIDFLFQSAATLGSNAVGVILTGMGRDGATGLGAMRRAGAWTIGQDAATSTVYGMPRVANEENAVCEVLPLSHISKSILTAAAKRRREVIQ